MAPLAYTLALLAMTMGTAVSEMKPLDMAQNSFDDQYQDCGPAMTEALPALIRSDFQKNPVFARVWPLAAIEWQKQGSRVSPLSSSDHAIALMAYTMGAHSRFNAAVSEAGRSRYQYWSKFHYKSLHFLLTDALATLRDIQKGQCLDVFHRTCDVQFEAQRGDTVRFSEFFITWLKKPTESGCPDGTEFQVHTCHGAGMPSFSQNPEYGEVLIPPFETFKVTEFTREGGKVKIQLRSTGTSSKYNCEWLRGGSESMAPFHLGGFLLATAALAVATGII